ncbi:hypothetical protein [Chryseobacterium indologenes]|uniref:hypothetical protein n=1 Tax=Chryseobacterium indologenes TaxID=253 RepID=UPI003D32B8A3
MYKEKAQELISIFKSQKVDNTKISDCLAARFAVLAVEEIIKSNPFYFYPGRKVSRISDHSTKEYWQEVKQELISLIKEATDI